MPAWIGKIAFYVTLFLNLEYTLKAHLHDGICSTHLLNFVFFHIAFLVALLSAFHFLIGWLWLIECFIVFYFHINQYVWAILEVPETYWKRDEKEPKLRLK